VSRIENRLEGDILTNPRLARCDDRSAYPKSNHRHGSPEEWFSEGNLSSLELVPISVDFFVNWGNNPSNISRNVWIKKILQVSTDRLKDANGLLDAEKVSNVLVAHEGTEKLNLMCRFFFNLQMRIDYLIFREIDWKSRPEEKIILARPTVDQGNISFQTKFIDTNDLRRRIWLGSGGDVRVGAKGLTYGTSSLECFLSETDSAYPGDVDLILVNKSSAKAIALFEYKKHNLQSSVREQTLSNYYPRPDRRKYERLAILRDYIDPAIPLINLYYPTHLEKESKLEIIDGDPSKLADAHSVYLKMPVKGDKESMLAYISNVLDFIGYETTPTGGGQEREGKGTT